MGETMPSIFFRRSISVLAAALAASSAGCAATTAKPDQSVTEQPAATPSRPPSPRAAPIQPIEDSLEHFVPEGWVVFAKARADLDRDGRQDMVALVEHKRAGKSVDGYPMPRSRYVMVVVQGERFARLAAMSRGVLRGRDAFGMYGPSVQLQAGHGRFSITQSGGTSGHRWLYTLDFQHHRERGAWFLASCSFETNSYDVRGRPQSRTGSHSYSYTLKNDFGHFDRDEFNGFCPEL